MTNAVSSLNQFEAIVDNQGRPTKRGKDFFDALWNRTGGANTSIPDVNTLLLKANNLSDVPSTSTARSNLGLGTIATQNATAVNLSGTFSGNVDVSTFKINSSTVSATASELNKLSGCTATTSELNKLSGCTATTSELNKLHGAPLDASFTIGAEAANTIKVTVQLKDADAVNLATIGSLMAYFSDASNGSGFIATAPSGAVAIAANGALYDIGSNKKVFQLISTTTGLIDINITEAGVKTFYLVLVLPNGLLKVSSAIAFT
jgi:hypothetical protein